MQYIDDDDVMISQGKYLILKLGISTLPFMHCPPTNLKPLSEVFEKYYQDLLTISLSDTFYDGIYKSEFLLVNQSL